MGIKNFLIEGMSGSGKTTVVEELQRRGYHVVHGDRVLAYVGDPETSEPMDYAVARLQKHWVWRVDSVTSLAADHASPITFFCGGSRNFHLFRNLFARISVLDIDLETPRQLLTKRPSDEFGGRRVERDLIARLHATRSDIPDRATLIDATAPILRVVDEILTHCQDPLDRRR